MTDAIAIRTNTVSKLNSQLDFILLDGSSSMTDKWWPMLEAIDTYIATLKAGAVDSHIMVDVFDNIDIAYRARDTHISDWKTSAVDPIGAHWGMTPLYDAIIKMGSTIRDLNPSRCAITIVTDGEDNCSRMSITQARAVLDWLRAQGFTVTFIGCNFDNSRQARALGANASNSIGVRKELLIDAAKSYGRKRTVNARTGEDINFSEDERKKFGGYLTHNGGK